MKKGCKNLPLSLRVPKVYVAMGDSYITIMICTPGLRRVLKMMTRVAPGPQYI